MSQSSQDKSQAPTRRRLRKAREEGQVARSRELSSSGILLICSLILTIWAPQIGACLLNIMRQQLQHAGELHSNIHELPEILGNNLLTMLKTIVTPLAVLAASLVILSSLPGGFILRTKNLLPDLSKLNPLKGLARIFSSQNRIELLKAIIKCLLIVGVMTVFMQQHWPTFIALCQQSFADACSAMLSLLTQALLVMGITLGVIAFADVPYQQWQFIQNLKMSKEEIKEERRSSEGRPEVKMRIRKIQIMMAKSRLRKRVPKADVILMNPTHYAVALCYDAKKAQAPYVVAKGQDEMAMRIKELALEHKKMIFTLPELTRAIYFSTQIDQEIPSGLYTAVAYVLSHVMQLKAYREGRGKEPQAMPQIQVPSKYLHTEQT